MACRPFYQDSEAPIWYGRVDRLGPLNQKLFVYGFVTNHEKVELEFELEYKMLIRAKMMEDENWIYLNEFESFTTQKVTCDGESDLCGRAFSTGYLPELEYEMYDVAIEVKHEMKLDNLKHVSINFHM